MITLICAECVCVELSLVLIVLFITRRCANFAHCQHRAAAVESEKIQNCTIKRCNETYRQSVQSQNQNVFSVWSAPVKKKSISRGNVVHGAVEPGQKLHNQFKRQVVVSLVQIIAA